MSSLSDAVRTRAMMSKYSAAIARHNNKMESILLVRSFVFITLATGTLALPKEKEQINMHPTFTHSVLFILYHFRASKASRVRRIEYINRCINNTVFLCSFLIGDS